MAYLDYVGLAYFKSILDENYLRTDYSGDTIIQGNVTFTEPVDADVKNDYLGNQIDKTYIKNLRPEDDGEVALIYGDDHEEVITIDTAVTQVRSDANEMYPILLCYDANAEVNQISKSVRYGHNVAINPAYGYVYANSYVVKHPTYNRTISPTVRVEWASDFRDSVLNPVGQVFEYIDPVSSGGEHRMEFRLYGNPNVAGINTPNVNDETNTISMGVSATRGDALTFFGYCPSTPIYLENGSTMRKSLTRGDQYGRDIITRDWLNLNGSITGLVHTYMDETIDGAKIFKKTVTINSGDNSNKAGLYVQGNSDVHGNEHVYGTETVDGKLTANGTAEIKGGSGNTPSLTITGDEKVTGNSNVTGNSSIGGNETVGGNISTTNGNISTTNGTVSGKTGVIGSGGLTVNGNETVTGEIYKTVNNTPQEYVSYVTNKQETKTTIVNNLIKDKGGLAVDANKNIYVYTGKGLVLDSSGKINVDFSQLPSQDIANIISGMVSSGSGLVADSDTGKLSVDFNQMPTDKFELLLNKLHLPLWVGERNGDTTIGTEFYVATTGVDSTADGRGRSADKPWKTIAYATQTIAKNYNISTKTVHINVAAGEYAGVVDLPLLQRTTGRVIIRPASANDSVIISRDNTSGACLSHTGGLWEIHSITLKRTIETATSSAFPSVVNSSDSSGSVLLRNCPIQVIDNTAEGSPTDARLLWCSGGSIQIDTYDEFTDSMKQITWSRTGTDKLTSLKWLYIENSGVLQFLRNTAPGTNVINVTGTFNFFARIIYMGLLRYVGTGTGVTFTGNATGTEFGVSTGGAMVTDAENNAHWFPGDTNGWVASNSGAWISPAANYE